MMWWEAGSHTKVETDKNDWLTLVELKSLDLDNLHNEELKEVNTVIVESKNYLQELTEDLKWP